MSQTVTRNATLPTTSLIDDAHDVACWWLAKHTAMTFAAPPPGDGPALAEINNLAGMAKTCVVFTGVAGCDLPMRSLTAPERAFLAEAATEVLATAVDQMDEHDAHYDGDPRYQGPTWLLDKCDAAQRVLAVLEVASGPR